MANLIQEIEAQIAGARATVIKQNVGVIRELGDGVARVEGLGDVMLNEMLDLGHGVTGIALSLEETDVGVIIIGDDTSSRRAGSPRDRQAASGASGQGAPGSSRQHARRAARRQRPDRQRRLLSRREGRAWHHAAAADQQPVQTGIMAVNAAIPIGRGQRELIIGDRSTGKTHLRRHDHQPGPPEQRGGSGGRQGLPSALLHLRRHRPEAIDDRTAHLVLEESGAMPYDRRRGSGRRVGDEPVSGTVCRRRDRRMVHGQRHGR
jgi:F-type H+-transporting ATPase subunit alpha